MDNSLLIWLLRCLILIFPLCLLSYGLWEDSLCTPTNMLQGKKCLQPPAYFLVFFSPCLPTPQFAQSGASGLTFLCCRAAVRQDWELLSFSPHTTCCGQDWPPWRAFSHSETGHCKTTAIAVLPGPEPPISSSARGAGDAPGMVQFSQQLLSYNFPLILCSGHDHQQNKCKGTEGKRAGEGHSLFTF